MKPKRFSMRLHSHYCFVTFCCNLYTLYPALATVTWYGDFSTNTGATVPNLLQYPTLQCGGTGYNNQQNPPWSCPTLNDGRAFNGPQSTSGIQAPLLGCPQGDASTCRLFFVQNVAAPPAANCPPLLQVRLDPNDFSNAGHRNELVGVKEQNGFKTEYVPGDDRYFAWYTQFPADFPPPDPNWPSWRNFGQFHGDGNCGGPPQDMAIVKPTPTSTTYETRLTARTVYNDFSSEVVLWRGPPDFGNWHNYVLHVYFSQTPCNNGSPCNWDNPNGGAIELWRDGVYQGGWAMTTLYTWPPDCTGCTADCDIQHPGQPMNSYLKQGLYRDEHLTSTGDRVFHCGMKAATTCLDVLGSCARTPAIRR
jgi:hypothetical protein